MTSGGGGQTTTVQQSLPPEIQSRLGPFLDKADAQLSQPYQGYTGPRVAGFTADQDTAAALVRNSAGRDYGLNVAGAMQQSAGSTNTAAMALPYFRAATARSGEQAAMPFFANASGSARDAASPYLSTAMGITGQKASQAGFDAAKGISGAGAAKTFLQAAADRNSVSAAMPSLAYGAQIDAAAAASPLVERGVNQSAAGSAAPFINAGTQSFAQNAGAYMSPYTSGVVDEISRLGARNLSENLLPAVNSTFTGGGQFGSSRNADFTARAVRDANESILGQQRQALESGYRTAADIYGQDAARQIQAAQTAGSLTSSDASRALQGAETLGSLTNQNAMRNIEVGRTLGQLTSADADRMAQIGATAGNLSAADADRLANIANMQAGVANQDRAAALQAAQLSGSLSQSDLDRQLALGQSLGQLASSDADRYAGLGSSLAGIAGNDAARQLQAGNALAQLGLQRQGMDLTGAAALQGVGAQQQMLNQGNLDAAYQDFLEQRGYPRDQLNWYSSLLRGTPQAGSTTSTAPGPSTLSQLGGLGMTGVSLIGATGGFGPGGWLSGLFRKGGRVQPRKMARGGLAGYAIGGMAGDDDDDVIDLTGGLPLGMSPASMAAQRQYRSAAEKMLEDYAKPRGDFDRWMPLLAGGLGMMGGQSPNALANVGQGGLAALSTYAAQRGADRERDRDVGKLRLDMAKLDLDAALKRDALAAKSASPWIIPGATDGAAPSPGGPPIPPGTPAPAPKVQAAIPDYAEYEPFIVSAAKRFNLPPEVLRGVISIESSGDARAVSPKGAQGLMQVMPGTYDDLAKRYGLGANANDPENNIMAGAAYLAEMRDRYGGDMAKALAAYNAGPGGFERSGGDFSALPAETQGYLQKAAKLGLIGEPAGAPRRQTADAGDGVRYVRPINQRTGKMAEFEVPIINGRPDMTRARPAQDATLFSGTSIEGQALNKMVADGRITREQALAWAAGKTVAGPNGQLDFITPTAAGGATGTMPQPGAPAGTTPSGAGGMQSIRLGQLAPQDKQEIIEADEVAAASQNAIKALGDALGLNDKAYSGALANERTFLSRQLGGGPRSEATTMMNNIVGEQALSQLKTIFGGNPTEGERKILLDLQASVEKSPEERKAIIERAISLAQSRMERARQKSQMLREGTYYSANRPAAQPDTDPLGIR